MNALMASQELQRRIQTSEETATELRRILEQALDHEDRQFRQVATWLLGWIYSRYEVNQSEWPDQLIANLVDGLRDDDIRGGALVSNASESLGTLYGLESRRPVGQLRELLASNDAQARFSAAVLIAHYLGGTVEREVSDELASQLADDRRFLNEITALQALLLLGRENLSDLLERFEVTDWQEGALLQIAASRLGIEWSASEGLVEEWLSKVAEAGGHGTGKIPVAALYLHPDVQDFARRPDAPGLLRRLVRLGPSSGEAADRARWAESWFWFLGQERRGPDGYPLPASAQYVIETHGFTNRH